MEIKKHRREEIQNSRCTSRNVSLNPNDINFDKQVNGQVKLKDKELACGELELKNRLYQDNYTKSCQEFQELRKRCNGEERLTQHRLEEHSVQQKWDPDTVSQLPTQIFADSFIITSPGRGGRRSRVCWFTSNSANNVVCFGVLLTCLAGIGSSLFLVGHRDWTCLQAAVWKLRHWRASVAWSIPAELLKILVCSNGGAQQQHQHGSHHMSSPIIKHFVSLIAVVQRAPIS